MLFPTKIGAICMILRYVVLYEAEGAHFQFPEIDPCEIIDIDATFHLRYDDGSGHTEEAPVFTLDNATVHNESSTCVDADLPHYLNFDLHPSSERLSLTFKQINDSEVQMSVTFKMDPTKHFKDLNQSAVVMEDNTHLQVGDLEHSYRCITEQLITFTDKTFFALNMTIRNVHLQAFNLNGSQYSPAIECNLDTVTTEVPTVSGMTSSFSTITSVTSEEPVSEITSSPSPVTSSASPVTSSASTAEPTTMPPIPRLHFEVKKGNITCIVLDGSFSLSIPYLRKDNTESIICFAFVYMEKCGMAIAVIQVPDDAISLGSSCQSNDRELLQFVFFNDNNKTWSLDINIVRSGTTLNKWLKANDDVTYSWRNVGLTYHMDSHFPNAKDQSGDVKGASSADLTGTFQATSEGSYKCDKQQMLRMDNVTLTVSKLQYRAFGATETDKYPDNNVVDCESPPKSPDKNHTGRTIGIIVGCCGGVIIIVVVIFLIVRKKRRSKYAELQG